MYALVPKASDDQLSTSLDVCMKQHIQLSRQHRVNGALPKPFRLMVRAVQLQLLIAIITCDVLNSVALAPISVLAVDMITVGGSRQQQANEQQTTHDNLSQG